VALTIIVRSGDGKSPSRITFDAPRVVIGRGEGCEVRLPDASVSHRHASIRQRGAEYIVLDEGSANGTFVGPVRLSPQAPRVLTDGDLVRIGRVWIEVRMEQAVPTANVQVATRELALALVAQALAAEGESSAIRVKITEGPSKGTELLIDTFDRPYTVGRLPSADLHVDDADLSRRHVELFRRGERLFIRDLGSKNGSELGGRRMNAGEEAPWPKGETLSIGQTKLVFEDPVGEALEEIDRAADERIDEAEFIDPPKGVSTSTETTVLTTATARRGAPVTPRPRRAPAGDAVGWTLTDIVVAILAVAVLALSIGGLVWLMRSG
jgi:pSer/pThr/pTyr-binding forkhead associated (FHA) protein